MPSPADLAEIEAIKHLKARYVRSLDIKDRVGWRKVFTDDVAVRVDHAVAKDGQEAVTSRLPDRVNAFVTYMVGFPAGISTVHHMPEMRPADAANGVRSMEDIVGSPGGRVMRGHGHHHEGNRRQDKDPRTARPRIARPRLDCSGPWPTDEAEPLAMQEMPGGAPN